MKSFTCLTAEARDYTMRAHQWPESKAANRHIFRAFTGEEMDLPAFAEHLVDACALRCTISTCDRALSAFLNWKDRRLHSFAERTILNKAHGLRKGHTLRSV